MTTKFDLQGYYAHEKKIGPQGGGWAEPTMTNQQMAHEIYTTWQDKSDLKKLEARRKICAQH